MSRCDVLVVGAGPTGLALALWLSKFGVAVRVIDKTLQPGTTSRALAVQARTLELYRQLDLADEVVKRGHVTPAVNLWVKGAKATRVSFETVGVGLTPYPFLHVFPQDQHERLLIDRLAAFGVRVGRATTLLDFESGDDGVKARLQSSAGDEICETAYIAGCDGARSVVRQKLGVGFPGGTYRQVFYVADIDAEGPALDGELHVDLDQADFLAVFPLAGPGRAGLIGTVRDERADRAETLKFEDVADRAIRNMKVVVRDLHWFSTYRVHHRVAERFRQGRAFLLGDAAHIHSPAGGQGMNTGIGDAINLAWKLASALRGGASETLLDSYEAERIAFARRLVATTDQAFSLATADGAVANVVRTRIAPLLIPAIAHFDSAREFLFRTVAQLTLNYRDGPLSSGVAGEIRGGDRLPWVAAGGVDNFASLATPRWQVHVYGSPSEDLRAWCASIDLPLHAFDWRDEHARAGLMADAAYLIRPDGYVGLAEPTGDPRAIKSYAATRALVLVG